MDLQKSIDRLKRNQQICPKKLAGANQDEREAVFRRSISDDKWHTALSKVNHDVT